MPRAEEIEVEGRSLSLTNLGKVLYPKAGFTKAQVIDYYVRISPFLLPHLADRPLTLKRYPNGVEGHFFYEKRCPQYRPEWVKTVEVWSSRAEGGIPFCLANDLPSLVWAANLADLELHTSLSLGRTIERPTMVVFDLDPGAPADLVQCCVVGLRVRALLERLGLESWAKTSGSKGLQIYAPLNTPITYEQTKPFAKAIAMRLEREDPELVVSSMRKTLRVGKILVDWSQNDEKKTTVCVYSLRARERPTVSLPVTWDEVEKTARDGKRERLILEADAAVARAQKKGDLFAPLLELKQKLPKDAVRAVQH